MVNFETGQLTQRERDCLRLVAAGKSSKEIAADLGISHHTVDLHLKRAMKALGAANRREAARLHAANSSADNDTQGLVTQPQPLAEMGQMTAQLHPTRIERHAQFRVPFLRQGRQFNDLTPVHRLGWTLVIALLLLLAAANFLNGLGALHTITG